jgi:hypothetical protein
MVDSGWMQMIGMDRYQVKRINVWQWIEADSWLELDSWLNVWQWMETDCWGLTRFIFMIERLAAGSWIVIRFNA